MNEAIGSERARPHCASAADMMSPSLSTPTTVSRSHHCAPAAVVLDHLDCIQQRAPERTNIFGKSEPPSPSPSPEVKTVSFLIKTDRRAVSSFRISMCVPMNGRRRMDFRIAQRARNFGSDA